MMTKTHARRRTSGQALPPCRHTISTVTPPINPWAASTKALSRCAARLRNITAMYRTQVRPRSSRRACTSSRADQRKEDVLDIAARVLRKEDVVIRDGQEQRRAKASTPRQNKSRDPVQSGDRRGPEKYRRQANRQLLLAQQSDRQLHQQRAEQMVVRAQVAPDHLQRRQRKVIHDRRDLVQPEIRADVDQAQDKRQQRDTRQQEQRGA